MPSGPLLPTHNFGIQPDGQTMSRLQRQAVLLCSSVMPRFCDIREYMRFTGWPWTHALPALHPLRLSTLFPHWPATPLGRLIAGLATILRLGRDYSHALSSPSIGIVRIIVDTGWFIRSIVESVYIEAEQIERTHHS